MAAIVVCEDWFRGSNVIVWAEERNIVVPAKEPRMSYVSPRVIGTVTVERPEELVDELPAEA